MNLSSRRVAPTEVKTGPGDVYPQSHKSRPMITEGKQFHIWTIGCQMNTADSQHVADALETLGYANSAELEEADVAVVNTCVVRQSAEDKAVGKLGALKQWKSQKPERILALMGCMVGVKPSPALRKKFPYVDVFMPPSESTPLVNYLQSTQINLQSNRLQQELAQEYHLQQDLFTSKPDARSRANNEVAAFVPIVYGCSHACTFCIIPFRRGVERSRPVSELVKEIEYRVQQGAREITLLGQIVDRYGYDMVGALGHSDSVPVQQGLAASGAPDLADLLEEVHKIPGLWRIRFLTSHPSYFSDRILHAVRDLPKVCEHFEVPVQAGNDEVLARMRRGYTNAEYRELVERIRKAIPDCGINTDIIVGFCGETDSQFEDTYHLLRELELDKAHLARYSPRPGTVSARRMADDVPDAVKKMRHRRLEALMEGICQAKNQLLLGTRQELLIEKLHRGKWLGRTPQNKLVFVESDQELKGQMITAEIIWTGPWSMQGRLDSILEMPAG